jgi:DNA-binding protein Alba
VNERIIVVGKKSISSYLIDVAIMFQEGVSSIVIKGYCLFISKALDLYNSISSKMKESIKLDSVLIGSEPLAGKMKAYIAIKISSKY